jgi:NAD dependent epimerase/dehydratase family enzyme
MFAMENESLQGAINVTAPNPVTNAEFAHALGRALHRPAVLPVPAFALRLAFGAMAEEALLASQRAMPSRLVCAGFQFRYAEIDGALRAALE